MEHRIVLQLLSILGIKEATESDFSRVVQTLRIDALPRKVKLLLFLGLPVVKGYLEYFLNPDKPVIDETR